MTRSGLLLLVDDEGSFKVDVQASGDVSIDYKSNIGLRDNWIRLSSLQFAEILLKWLENRIEVLKSLQELQQAKNHTAP